MTPKVILLIDNVSMGYGHDGLKETAKKFGIDIDRMRADVIREGKDPQEELGHLLLMFLNRAKDKLKILSAAGLVVGYIRMPRGHRIMLDAIQYLPKTFGSSGFNYDAALKQALQNKLARPINRPVNPLRVYKASQEAYL